MVVSKRERIIALAAVVGLTVLGVDQLLVGPLFARQADADSRIATARQRIARDEGTVAKSQKLRPKWAALVAGPLKADASGAESQVLHFVRDSAQAAGMNLTSVKPERTEKEKDFVKLTLRATGSGRLSEVTRFLHRLQTASIPVTITDLQLSARKEGTDDLSVQLGVATICIPPDAEKPAPGNTPSTKEAR